MQRATTTRASHAVDVEPHILPRQMVGQWLAMGTPFGLLLLDPRTVLFFAGEVTVEIFKSERQLIGIESLGATTELHSLELLDDRLESLDLAVPMFNRADNIADQAMQKCCFCRETF
jgi:hypothetical protein